MPRPWQHFPYAQYFAVDLIDLLFNQVENFYTNILHIKSNVTSGAKKNVIVIEIKSTLQTMYQLMLHVNTIYYKLKNTCINRKYNR